VRMLRQVAEAIRHHPMLEGADGLWNALRKPYHLALGFGGRGTKVLIGGKVAVRIPPDLSGRGIENFELETINALVQWAKQHPGGLFIDVGSSIGLFSASIMFLDPISEVIAIDGDIESVAATRRFCQYAPTPTRLTTIHGLITDDAPPSSLTDAVSRTKARLLAFPAQGTLQSIKYADLHSASEDLPRYRLDDLLVSAISNRPTLIKCDVEGAELFVLRGAARLLSETRCELLLSVHPQCGMMAVYGHTVEDVRKFLEHLDYQIKVVAEDHELHWWCTPTPRSIKA
jgi:FkbM family methyltransferase